MRQAGGGAEKQVFELADHFYHIVMEIGAAVKNLAPGTVSSAIG
jgi:hypothetical protein